MKPILLLILVALVVRAQAQFSYVLDQSVEVRDANGDLLANPWAGGFNSGQFNTLDINNDGREDLIVFDRMTKRLLTFINEKDHYRYDPDYEQLFPDSLSDWVLLRDFNCDGKKDLFTREDLGIIVYKNVSDDSGPKWERYTKSVIYTQGTSSLINLLPGFNDVPVVMDVDGDGDMDILNFRFVAPSTVEFHQNMSVERYGRCDSLVYDRVTSRYGDFEECLCGSFEFNGVSCTSSTGRLQHTQGRSLLVLDADGDGDLDLLFSEENCSQLYYLQNTGTTDAPIINSNVIYPASHPVELLYPTSFYEDVTFDGQKDLIVSTGLLSKNFQDILMNQSSILFKNTGTTASPSFTWVKNNFLQDQMIDVGDNAVPAFIDADGDGDLDMFISNDYNEPYHASITYYENTGTKSEPSFQLVTDDYAFFSATDLFNMKIRFADLNDDGKPDLVFTATSASTEETWLYYVANLSAAGLNIGGQTIVPLMKLADYPSSDNVSTVDVDGDGTVDLLIGRPDGSLQYWKNTGTKGAPNFADENDAFLGFSKGLSHESLDCAAADLDGDGKIDLVLGDNDGKLSIIPDFIHASLPAATVDNLVYNGQLKTYIQKNLGGPLWPTVGNIFNANRPSIIVGNQTGGLLVLKNDNGVSLPDEPLIQLFPNPVEGQGSARQLHVIVDRPAAMQLYTLMGQQVGQAYILSTGETVVTLPSFLSQGIYLARFTLGGTTRTRRILIL